MDLSLKGKQSDASNGRYANLQNSGALTLKKIKINSEFLPLPFVIEEGDFSFYQDTVSVPRPGFYAHRFLDFCADRVFKKIPSRKFHFSSLLYSSYLENIKYIEYFIFSNTTEEEYKEFSKILLTLKTFKNNIISPLIFDYIIIKNF
jgi:hypothetical protein